jgi:hypothetical protein
MMENISWSFGGRAYGDPDEFITAVTARNEHREPEHNAWDPSLVVADGPVRVSFEAMWRSENDLLDLIIGEPGVPLTMATLLREINNASVDFFKGVDESFFEGLKPLGDGVFLLRMGS